MSFFSTFRNLQRILPFRNTKMRSSERSKVQKKPYKHPRISKKKNKNKSKGNWDWNDDVSGLFLNNINEVLRENKARRAEGKGSWKVVPKDSCEVYKDRRKRETKKKVVESSFNSKTLMDVDKKKKPRKKHQKKKFPAKRFITKPKYYKRSSYASSQSSYTTSTCTSTSVSTSYSTISEMEYE